MRIGIDLGGSHIGIGLIDDGNIIQKKEHNFSEEEKQNINETIRKFLYQEMDNLFEKFLIENIEMVGISTPRKT